MRKLYSVCVLLVSGASAFAQAKTDSLPPKQLQQVEIKAWIRRDIGRLPDEQNGFNNSGKKSEVITLAGTDANIALKTGRQVFAKIPGLFVYDMDGSGNQLNVSTRGLDPHRGWEYNTRQNGIITNSDMYGYPASHYSAPMESYEKIELVRGTGSLQYGAQFGGMINMVTKKADSTKAFSFESVNTAGSFNLLSSYNAIGGTHKKFSYYAYYYRRHADGYRDNSQSDAEAQFVQLQWQLNDRLSVKAELGRSKYRHHIPGPLNDSMFAADPTMSTRSRNYFSPDIYIPSVSVNWQAANRRTRISWVTSGVFGTRSSVMLDAFATVPDTVNRITGLYRNRQVDIDQFNSRTTELRLLHPYRTGSVQQQLSAGVAYMNNHLHRRQLGEGTPGSDYDLTLVTPGFGRDIHFKTNNIALFAENKIQLGQRFSLSPGVRWESGQSDMSGQIKYYTVNPLPTTISHNFVLLGISGQYQLQSEHTVYGGVSQAYRPVIFKDIVPASTYEQIDKNLEDADGYNAELGIRGKLFNHLQYDISWFRMVYRNRLGTIVQQDNLGQTYTYKTNTGDSRTNGAEIFIQYKFALGNNLYAGLFTSTSYMDARYTSGQLNNSGTNTSIIGNRVEAVPRWISRNGLELLYKGFSCTFLYSYVSDTYSDAFNTEAPPATGARGYTPSYGLLDWNASMRIYTNWSLRVGVSNLLDKQYFTKRPTFYPGPGIWPSDGRSMYVTAGIKL